MAALPTTGLPMGRTSDNGLPALDRRIREEFERARRYSLSFSLILLGVDELEGVRERLGTEAADQLKARRGCRAPTGAPAP